MKRKLIYLFLLIALLSFNSYAQLRFKHYGMESGFSDISFRAILQDKKGFLWFATINGLNRYDGNNIKVYINEHDNPNSLSYNRIYAIYEDFYGYIWIVTYDSEIHRLDTQTDQIINLNNILNQKTGKGFSTFGYYESSPGIIWIYSRSDGAIRITEKSNQESELKMDFFNNSNILPSNTIRFIHKDKTGSLWIGSVAGLIRLDSDTISDKSSSFTSFLVQDSTEFTAYCENENEMLFGTMNDGLFLFNFNKKEFTSWNKYKMNSPIWGIEKGKFNDVLIATQGEGLFYIMSGGSNFVHLKPGEKRGDIVEKNYEIIYIDSYGKFWIRRPKRGITYFDPQYLKIKTYTLHSEIRESAGEKDAPKLLEDSNRDLWITLYGGGLCKLNRETMLFDQYLYKADNPNSLSSNFILSIFEDNSANLWIGTYQGGLNKIELKKYPFDFTQPYQKPLFQSLNEVRAVMVDKFNRTWIGTKEGHILCYNFNGENLFRFPDDVGLPEDYIQSNVYELFEDNRGNLWIGTKGYGLYIIEGILSEEKFKNTYNIKNFQHKNRNKSPIENYQYDGLDENPNYLSQNDVYAIHQDQYGQMWIGTYAGGLNLVENIDDISFIWFKNNPLDSNSLTDNKIRYIFQDSKKNLLICTTKGLVLLEEKDLKSKKKKFIRLKGSPVENTSLANNDIISCFEDSKNRIWTGTYGDGLNLLRYDTISGYYYKNFNVKNGLPSAVVHTIEEDGKGNLWLGTDNGLCRFNYETKKTENYFKEEGLGDNLFSEGASDKNGMGKLIFGQKNGFISFYPDSIEKDTLSYNIFITNIKVLGETLIPATDGSPLLKTIEFTKEIILKHDQNFIEIQYAILDFMNPKRCQYKYILEGIDKNWIFASNNQIATYTNLDHGNYKFRVQAANHDGYWSKQEAILNIKIKPPYYKTWLFRIFTLIIILSLIYSIYLYRISILTKRQLILEKLVKERTFEVEEKNKILLQQTDELNEINKVLEEGQNYIVEQSEELKAQAEDLSLKNDDLEKSNATKDKLFSIIAHDLKNPFNSILGFCKILIDKDETMDRAKRLQLMNIVYKSSKNIYNLLENLLQWSRSQMGSIKFQAESLNLSYLVHQNISLLENMLKAKEISIDIDINKNIYVYADSDMVNTIIRNLISNSIKFTEKGSIQISAKEANKIVLVEITDTGVGISKDKLDQLFSVDKSISGKGTQGEQGSGLGLIICKEFVEKNNGTIFARSIPGNGTTLAFTLPLYMK